MLLKDASKRFLTHCNSVTTLSDHTLRAYGGDLNDCHQFFGPGRRLSLLRKENLRAYIRHMRDERRLKETTIKRRLATLKLLFKWAAQEEFTSTNPFATLNEKIRLPKRLPRALDRGDQALLRKATMASYRGSCFDDLRSNTVCWSNFRGHLDRWTSPGRET